MWQLKFAQQTNSKGSYIDSFISPRKIESCRTLSAVSQRQPQSGLRQIGKKGTSFDIRSKQCKLFIITQHIQLSANSSLTLRIHFIGYALLQSIQSFLFPFPNLLVYISLASISGSNIPTTLLRNADLPLNTALKKIAPRTFMPEGRLYRLPLQYMLQLISPNVSTPCPSLWIAPGEAGLPTVVSVSVAGVPIMLPVKYRLVSIIGPSTSNTLTNYFSLKFYNWLS